MIKSLHLTTLIFIGALFFAQTALPDNLIPDVSPEVLKRITEDRYVFVRVRDNGGSKSNDAKKDLQIHGQMLVNASASQSYGHLIVLQNLKKISSIIKRADYDASTQILEFVCEAFGYVARMQIRVEFAEDPVKHLKFKVIGGTMRGYEGRIQVNSQPRLQSMIEFASQYDYVELPIPRLFVEFGFGVIFQKIAERIRINIEDEKRLKGA